MYEFLEKLFGTGENGEPKALTFAELQTALEADKDIKLVNLKDGGYVSQEKFDAKETELKGVKTQLEDANKQIQSFKDVDVEGIKSKVSEWETKYTADTEALRKQMEEQETRHQRDMYFSNVKFSSNAAKIGIMAEFDKQGFQLKDGVFQGADAWLEQQKKDDAASFVLETKPEENAGNPPQNDNQAPATQFNGNKPFPSFATSTSQGSGASTDPTKNFGFGFRGVRKRPEAN